MFSMTKKQAGRWIVILAIASALALAGALIFLLWVGTFGSLVIT